MLPGSCARRSASLLTGGSRQRASGMSSRAASPITKWSFKAFPARLFESRLFSLREGREMPPIKRKETKRQATIAARTLLELAALTAHEDLDLAKEQAALARRLMLKYNIRFGWDLKRFYCHGCKELMVPG